MSLKKGMLNVFIANIINLIISLFTGFVLPKLLSVESYANIKLFQLYITYIGILHFGFADGMYLKYGGKNIKSVDSKEILGEFRTFKIFQFAITIIAIIISISLKNEMLFFCSIVILPINVGNYLRNLYQAVGEFKKYSTFTNINTLLIFVINLILLLLIKTDNYYTYIIAYIVAYFIYWEIIEIENRKLFKKEKVKSNKKYLIEDVKSGFFLMIGNFCNVIFTSIDRLFVQNLLGTVKFAFYSFAVSIENLMNVFVTPITTVMYNYLCNNKEVEKVIPIKKIILIFSAFIVSVVFGAKFAINLWIEKYNDAITVMILLFAAQYVSIIIRCIQINLYKAYKKQNKYFLIMVGVVVLSVILNVTFYNINKSIEAIALATLVTNIVWIIIGETDFKQYRLALKEYIYIILILITFLLCGIIIKNAVIGFIVYIVIALLLTLILLNDTFKYCITQGLKYIKQILKKLKGEQTE